MFVKVATALSAVFAVSQVMGTGVLCRLNDVGRPILSKFEQFIVKESRAVKWVASLHVIV